MKIGICQIMADTIPMKLIYRRRMPSVKAKIIEQLKNN
jgi:hypothetical protein